MKIFENLVNLGYLKTWLFENLGYLKTIWKFDTWFDYINMCALYVLLLCYTLYQISYSTIKYRIYTLL